MKNDNTTRFPCLCIDDTDWSVIDPDWAYRSALPNCEHCGGQGWVKVDTTPKRTMDLVDLYENPPDPPEWLFDPIVMEGKYTLIYSPPGVGKSLISLWIAVAIAETEKHVSYIDNEMTAWDVHDRIYGGWDKKPDLISQYLHYYQHTVTDLMREAEWLRDEVEGHSLVVIDTMRSSTTLEENDAGAIAEFERTIINPIVKLDGIAILNNDHSGKDVDKGARGSSAKIGPADVVWALQPDQVDGVRQEELVVMKQTKKRWQGVPDGVSVHLDRRGLWFSPHQEEEPKPDNRSWIKPGG